MTKKNTKPNKPSRIRFLWADHVDGKPSTMKLWRHIAYITATYIMIKNAVGMNWELLMVYMAIVGSSELAQQLLKTRAGIKDDKKEEEEEPTPAAPAPAPVAPSAPAPVAPTPPVSNAPPPVPASVTTAIATSATTVTTVTTVDDSAPVTDAAPRPPKV